jgi:hypothetical protein
MADVRHDGDLWIGGFIDFLQKIHEFIRYRFVHHAVIKAAQALADCLRRKRA